MDAFWTLQRALGVLAVVFILFICSQVVGARLGILFQPATAHALWGLVRGLFPPDLSVDFLRTVSRALVSTVATAITGTILSVLMAIPLGALATPILWQGGIASAADSPGLVLRLRALASRVVFAFLGFLRAVPDLVWGLLFVTMVGLGSLAGALALAVAYAGVLGYVYADVFAHVDPQPLEALQATGASRAQIFLRGIWPQALPNLTAYSLYSFECCVRAASVLGFVGAGGIGNEISLSMRLFEYRQVMTLILAFVLLLATTDVVSQRLRGRLQPNAGDARNRRVPGRAALHSAQWRGLGYGILVAIIGASFYLAGFAPERLGEANMLRSLLRFVGGMIPPDFGRGFVLSIGPLLMQTVASQCWER